MCPDDALTQPIVLPKPLNHDLRDLAPEMAPEGLQEDLWPRVIYDSPAHRERMEAEFTPEERAIVRLKLDI